MNNIVLHKDKILYSEADLLWQPQSETTSSSVSYLAVIELDSKLGFWASRGGSVWANHGRSHSGLAMLPEGVLTENKVGQVERQTGGLPDPHLQQDKRQNEVTEGFCMLVHLRNKCPPQTEVIQMCGLVRIHWEGPFTLQVSLLAMWTISPLVSMTS